MGFGCQCKGARGHGGDEMKQFNKKASLNLSIQAIVIVVIAFVVLGLGLGFVRGQFEQITSTSTSVQEQISQQILDDLRTGNKKLSFPATSITLETNELSVQAIGIKNTEDADKNLIVGFEVKNGDIFEIFSSQTTLSWTTPDAIDVSSRIDWDDTPQALDAGESRVVPVTITAPSKTGNYLYKVVLTDADTLEEFDSKTFFIKTT